MLSIFAVAVYFAVLMQYAYDCVCVVRNWCATFCTIFRAKTIAQGSATEAVAREHIQNHYHVAKNDQVIAFVSCTAAFCL